MQDPARSAVASGERAPSASAQAAEPELGGAGARTTSSLGLWPWAQLAVQKLMPIERFCELCGVSVTALRDPEQRFSQAICNRLAALALERFGPGAAFEAALGIPRGHFNLLELIARSAPDVRSGLDQGCRFFALLHDGGRLSCEPQPGDAVALRWRPPTEYDVHHAYVELTFAVAVIGLRRETGHDPLVPVAVRFRHAAPADVGRHVQVLGVRPEFGNSVDEIVFDARVATLPLTRSNPELHAVAVRAGTEAIDA
jgi:hypothetical protein